MSLSTEVSREMLSRFPIDQLVLILSAGLTFILFLPIDIMSFNLADGLSIQRLQLSNLPQWVTDNCSKLLVQTRYVGDFPIGITLIFLLSAVFGLGIFLLQDVFEFVNEKIMRRAFRENGSAESKTNDSEEKKKADAKRHLEGLEFFKWTRRNHEDKYIEFLLSLYLGTVGCLFAFESLFFISLILTIVAQISSPVGIILPIATLILTVFCYISGKHRLIKITIFGSMAVILILLYATFGGSLILLTILFFFATLIVYFVHRLSKNHFYRIYKKIYDAFKLETQVRERDLRGELYERIKT